MLPIYPRIVNHTDSDTAMAIFTLDDACRWEAIYTHAADFFMEGEGGRYRGGLLQLKHTC